MSKRIGTFLVIAMLVVAAFYVGTAVTTTSAQTTFVSFPVVTPQPVLFPESVTQEEVVLSQLYQSVTPSVVSINVTARHPSVQGNSGLGDEIIEGTGTGFVIDTEGHIVTNAHVVEGATRVEVNFIDGTIVRGEVVGIDLDPDLAVVQINLPAEQLRPLSFANSDALFIGQEVVAIGSPFNQPWTMTTGIISALGRRIEGLNQYQIGSVIQTDAAINPGNSGGPLLNLDGQVIGVNAQILSQSRSNSGVGFAIPSNLTQRVAQTLISSGSVQYSYLGIGGQDINLGYIEALNLPNNARGVVVTSADPAGPAGQAGLQNPPRSATIDENGVIQPTNVDIITALDGTPITGMSSLVSYLAAYTQPGQTVQMTIVRNGSEELTLPVTLGARPSSNP
ncbi:MAG: trypsin-like peptidase domain-containing protein [Chloroflexi bacterium]|uniref:S1C family serine protease n=1 Tax=Candidatus Flexifilum breve TaxID=3140694 RepID=UPI0031346A6C|nr:trypsin-like peptidase domain-containing protein [Chloroflexota bacterium]